MQKESQYKEGEKILMALCKYTIYTLFKIHSLIIIFNLFNLMLSDEQKGKILDSIYANDLDSLQKGPTSFNFLYSHQDTSLDDQINPLSCAAYLGRREIVEYLISNPGIDLNMQTIDNGFTPLCAACVSGNYEIVRMLCEAGAEVDKSNFFGILCNKRTDPFNILLLKT